MTGQREARAYSMTGTGRLFVSFLLLLTLVVPAVSRSSSADAATCPVGGVEWDVGVVAGDWSDGGNWLGGAVPTGSDDVCIPADVAVTVDGSASVRQLVSNGAMIVDPGADLTIGSPVGSNSWIQSIENYGPISLTSGALRALFTVLGDGARLHAESGAEMEASGRSGALPWYAGTSGDITITGAGTVYLTGKYVASAPTTITSSNANLWLGIGGRRRATGGTLDGAAAGMKLYGDLVWGEYSNFMGLFTNEGTIATNFYRGGDIWRGMLGDFTNNGTIIWNPGGHQSGIGVGDYLVNTTIVNNGLIQTLETVRFVDFGFGGTFINHGTIGAMKVFDTTGMTVINDGYWVVESDQDVSSSNPLATSVQTPTGGTVSVREPTGVRAPPIGYEVVGTQFSRITAPDATQADPLLITFTIDKDVWDGIPLASLTVLRNGVPVLDCSAPGSTGPALPDPCVGSRSGTWGSSAEIVVRTSQASDWVMVRSLNSAPVCDAATSSLSSLWPPNHKYTAIGINGVADPDGDTVAITIHSIFQDEPVDGIGDGTTAPDGQGVGTSTADVRAERDGSGNGRVYHIGFTADDGAGGSCSGEVTVGVPKSKEKSAVDDGALYDSTIGG